MPLFQASVLKKYLSQQDISKITTAYAEYAAYFHNSTIQENIRNSKEEQFQEGFLRELFVTILGYTLNPTPNFNLTTEYKNVKDSKKADGAILVNDKVSAVIELKGTNTTDLGKIEAQAFGYKNNQPECVYVITSNFEKLRFYIDNAIEYLEFNLFQLNKVEFELLYLCLAYENIKNNVAKSIKDQSVSEEDTITKKLYKDYSLFKRELFQNLVQLNPQYDPLELFQKSQKLLDRFLFIFFAEDRNLLPTNLIFRINKEWQQLHQMRIQVSLYDRYKTYFDDLNTGAKVHLPAFSQTNTIDKEEHQIFAYNGGLFKSDDLLNTIRIDDAILFVHTEKMSNYDFASEVDVNILGHIFENSLNELDEVKSQLEGAEIDKTKTKRKKDGVFYTPKYITKYIVENTVGKLCTEKKAELGIADEDYTADKKRQKKTLQTLVEKLDQYRKWLLQLTICDPACGSGAFLNQALDFLIAEHQYIDELQAKLFGDAMVLSDIATSILEHNLFGVDLNEESVEIAKLSLWLRTAQPNRKLNDLNSNIKCGNSLIDEPEIAGYKAFNWQQAFPKVFEKGGFDVIIGNPPYVDSESMTKSYPFEREFISKKYKSASGNWDLFIPFFELGLNILKENGNLSFIIPNKILSASYGNTIREIINNNYSLYEIFDVSADKVFDVDVYPVTLFIKKNNEIKDLNISKKLKDSISNFRIPNPFELNWALYLNENFIFYSKIINQNIILLNNENYTISNAASVSEAYEIIEFIEDNNEINYDSFRLINTGTIDPYLSLWGIKNIVYLKKNLKYPTIKKTNIKLKSWTEKPKIIIAGMSLKIEAFYDLKNEFLPLKSTFLITSNDNESLIYLTTILNSRLINFLFRIANFANTMAGGYININKENLGNVPVKNISTSHKLPFIEKADLMLSLNKDLQEQSQKFQRTIQRKFSLEDLPKKLQDWYVLSYADFIKELAKKKVKLSLSEEAEWEDYFETESKKAQDLKAQIDATDKAIDAMVYELYGLSEEEIGIIENS
jgi:hypothetical protein